MSDPVSIALIGVSGYAEVHYALLLEQVRNGAVRIVAATVINQDEEKEKCATLSGLGCRIYSDYVEMLSRHRNGIDLCVIPTGIGWHEPMCIAALQAGANVLVEKPLAGDLQAADAIRMEEEISGRFIAVGFHDLYDPAVSLIKSRLLNGAIGPLRRITLKGLSPRLDTYYRRNAWAGKIAVDGIAIRDSPLNNAMAHYVTLALYLGGEHADECAEVQSVEADLYRANQIESFDTGTFIAKLASGVEFRGFVSHCCPVEVGPVLILEGDSGVLHWENKKPGIIDCGEGGREEYIRLPIESVRRRMIEAVVGKIRGRYDRICSSRIARSHCGFIDLVHKKGTIKPVTHRSVSEIERSGGTLRSIEGIEEWCDDFLRASADRHRASWSS